MSEAEVLDGCKFLSDSGFRPSYMKASARRWLDNFEAEDRHIAVALLESFVMIPSSMTDAMLQAAFHQLAADRCRSHGYDGALAAWASFRDELLVTIPTGEMPNPTDSGYSFQRSVRQLLEIDEAQIVEPHDALQALVSRGQGKVLFVDDFVGSGHQFVTTWHRDYRVAGVDVSFGAVCPPGSAFYTPLVATTTGVDHIATHCPEVELKPLHRLGSEYAANSPTTSMWQSVQVADGIAFVEKYTPLAGFRVEQAWGYEELGLAFAFEHGTPDATLPILYSERNAWRPLVRRR